MHHRPPNRVNDAENPYQAAALIAARHRGEWRWPTCARRWMSRHQEDGEEGCKEAASALSRELVSSSPRSPRPDLSPRESKTPNELPSNLRRSNVRNRAELVPFALETGMLQPD